MERERIQISSPAQGFPGVSPRPRTAPAASAPSSDTRGDGNPGKAWGGHSEMVARKRLYQEPHLDLRLLASRIGGNKFLWFKRPSFWYFVKTALAD